MSSCGDDDEKVDCGKVINEISTETSDLFEAMIAEDCQGIEDAYDDLIESYRKGKSCDALKEAAEDEGYSSYDEFLDELESERDAYLVDC